MNVSETLNNMKHHVHHDRNAPFLYLTSSSLGLNVVIALKQTKCAKWSKLNLASIDFDNIEIHKVKYMPTSLKGFFLIFNFLVAFVAQRSSTCI